MDFSKSFNKTIATGLLMALFGTFTLLGQEFAIPGFPEELMPPPEPPLPGTQRRFEYIGYAQTSQGPLQDDPMDRDLLMTRRGWTNLSDVFYPVEISEGYFGYQVPTFEGLIDMVVDRDTYLLGATPYDRAAGINIPDVLDHIKYITFEYKSNYSEYSNLTPLIRVYNNGTRVAQFALPDVAIRNRGNGSFPERTERVQIDLKNTYTPINTQFKLSEPGNYLVRVELTERITDPQGEVDYIRSGIAVDVFGKVVKTKVPSVTIVPIFPPSASQNAKEKMLGSLHIVSFGIGYYLPKIFPVNNKIDVDDYPVETTSFSADGGQFNDLYHMAQVFLRAKRFSDPNYRSDRIVAMVEWNYYQELLARGNIFTHPVFLCSAGFNWGKHFIAVPGEDTKLTRTRPYFKFGSRDAIHEILHTLDNVPWAPVEGKMGDCTIPPFHDQEDSFVSFGLYHDRSKVFPYAGNRCIMGKEYALPYAISQCTYRHALEILSRSEIDPPVIMVSGMATRNGLTRDATLNPLYQMDGFYELDEGGTGDWHILLKDELGNVLGDYPFDPLFQDGQLEASMPFNFTVPDLPGVRRIEITAPMVAIGGPVQQVLDAVDYSTFPPVIWDLAADKTPGQVEVRWAAYDFDGDPLHYTLLVSEDGLTYFPTPVSEGPQTEAVFEVPDSLSHLKLVVTDGSRSVSRVLTL